MKIGISENTVNNIKLLLSNKMIDVNTDTGIITVLKDECNNIKILNSKYGYNRQTIYGYYYLRVRINNKYYDIKDHMIIAFLIYGNYIIGNQIDHINNYHNYKYDNRANNLQVLSIEKHIKKSNHTYKNLNRTITYYPNKNYKNTSNTYNHIIKIDGILYKGNTYKDIAEETKTPIDEIINMYSNFNKDRYPFIDIIK